MNHRVTRICTYAYYLEKYSGYLSIESKLRIIEIKQFTNHKEIWIVANSEIQDPCFNPLVSLMKTTLLTNELKSSNYFEYGKMSDITKRIYVLEIKYNTCKKNDLHDTCRFGEKNKRLLMKCLQKEFIKSKEYTLLFNFDNYQFNSLYCTR